MIPTTNLLTSSAAITTARDRRRRAGLLSVGLVLACSLSVSFPSGAQAGDPWWLVSHDYRIAVEVGTPLAGVADAVVEVVLDLASIRSAAGGSSGIAIDSMGWVEASTGAAVPFQVISPLPDEAAGGDRMVVLLPVGPSSWSSAGTAGSDGTPRQFHLYLHGDGAAPFEPAAAVVTATEGVEHEGQPSVRIDTPQATYYFHGQGAGFASIEDRDGHDWIGYHPRVGSRAAGEFRGTPNLGVFGHPGYRDGSPENAIGATTILRDVGPLAVTIESTSTDGRWQTRWQIRPATAHLTVVEAGAPFWFLYEGTPGGDLDDRDYVVRSPGIRTPVGAEWQGDILGPEWVFFGDEALGRMLFVVHQEDDSDMDQYYAMDGAMTVFGFGREPRCCERHLTVTPAHFTLGIADVASQADGERIAAANHGSPTVRMGALERRPEGASYDGGVAGTDAGGAADGGGSSGRPTPDAAGPASMTSIGATASACAITTLGGGANERLPWLPVIVATLLFGRQRRRIRRR